MTKWMIVGMIAATALAVTFLTDSGIDLTRNDDPVQIAMCEHIDTELRRSKTDWEQSFWIKKSVEKGCD
ncbi:MULTISPECIES: hypothetical protein [unclassified Ruegeria]|uniref:hypothetical protein n=1 Tax=unclassified Ruegeria TaxID=2625375 RepID=UPI001491E377|nr:MULTISPECIES: hypothetical protein [unclassified Ruegeria]NOD87888.1 hypothetical protein [Ruegeria sp. HKCCD4318]NOE14258.1 hypothetical protein [Ruegeria sp. HKCCD4318-2]NOG08385.1 hypothetical protein [Ruegeria sp. HKCCD4315]